MECLHHMGRRLSQLVAALLLALLAGGAWGYKSETRQQLTFLAAKQFNECVAGTDVPRLTALQVRNLVRGNLSEGDPGIARRTINWQFYDRSNQATPRVLWAIETRMHSRFDELAEAVLADGLDEDLARFERLGEVVHYLQSVTVPANVVPIYHPRRWRWNGSDAFTHFPMDREALLARMAQVCVELLATPETEGLSTLLDSTAAVTIANIRAPIADMNASWQVFWREGEAGEFGSYGPAGNRFGREAEFPCRSERCRLLENDPIYAEFALRQHRQAVVSSMRAMLILQRFRAQRDPTLAQPPWDVSPYRQSGEG
ncbi:MAG: hypothetical protein JJT88_00910 [Gammaproteobacteria bacterium]|nr:hypothetical protein [Gammaproteobacteria bacterium]